MFSIKLDAPSDRVHFPGSLLKGVIKRNRPGPTSQIKLVLIANLTFETFRSGYTGNTHAIKEYRFLEVDIAHNIDTDGSPGIEWPFAFLLPDEVDWYKVDREWKVPLGVEDIALIPKDLPPSVGNRSHDPVSIVYTLVLTTGERSVSDKIVDRNGDMKNLYVCPIRRYTTPNRQIKAHAKAFSVHSHDFPQGSAERRNLKHRLSGALPGRAASMYHFTILFRLPQVCVVGEQLNFSVELQCEDTNAFQVSLGSLDLVLMSHTKIDIGLDFAPKGRGSDSLSHAHVFEGVANAFTTTRSAHLMPNREVSDSQLGARFVLSDSLSPSFQTLGLGRSYSIELSGEVRISSLRLKFALKRQMIQILPAWSQEQQRVLDSGVTELPPDMPPPAYSEVARESSSMQQP